MTEAIPTAAAPVTPAAVPQTVGAVRPVGLEPPSQKRLPCNCTLTCEPIDRASQTVCLVVDHGDCRAGHTPIATAEQRTWCACVLRSMPAEGTRQAIVIDFSRCTARSVPVPPTATPRP